MDENRRLNSEKGFTLVEILASIVLLTIVISVFLAIFPQMIIWSSSAEKELVTSNLTSKVAQEIWEDTTLKGLVDNKSGLIGICQNYVDLNALSNQTEPIIKDVTLNEVTYEVELKGCFDEKEKADNLMRVYFVVSNDKNKRKMESMAYVHGGGK